MSGKHSTKDLHMRQRLAQEAARIILESGPWRGKGPIAPGGNVTVMLVPFKQLGKHNNCQ